MQGEDHLVVPVAVGLAPVDDGRAEGQEGIPSVDMSRDPSRSEAILGSRCRRTCPVGDPGSETVQRVIAEGAGDGAASLAAVAGMGGGRVRN